MSEETTAVGINPTTDRIVLGKYEVILDPDTSAPVELICDGKKVRDLDDDDVVSVMSDVILSLSTALKSNDILLGRDVVEIHSPLLTNKYTRVLREADYKYNAPHRYKVVTADESHITLSDIKFQEGPIKECGVNGVCNEDLINMVIERLEHFQDSEFSCRENAVAITKLQEALMWLRFRTTAREMRGVEGTHTV